MNKAIVIKSALNYLEIRPVSKAFVTSPGEWITIKTSLKCGGFNGSFNAYCQLSDFVGLNNGLQKLYGDLSSEFKFEPIEGQLELFFKGDGIGHIKVNGIGMDEAGTGNSLSFTLDFDQTDLPRLWNETMSIINEFQLLS